MEMGSVGALFMLIGLLPIALAIYVLTLASRATKAVESIDRSLKGAHPPE